MSRSAARAFPQAMDGTNDSPAAGEPENKFRPVPRPDPSVKDKLTKLCARMQKIEDTRLELNADASLIREEVKNIGVDTATFQYARRIAKLDEQKRQAVDLSNRLMRETLGSPVQTDWLTITP